MAHSVALRVDADKEFRNYLATKHYSKADSLDFDDYLEIKFKTPNGLPEIINDIAYYLFQHLP